MICSTFVKKKNPTTRVSHELGLKSENARGLRALPFNLAQKKILGAKWTPKYIYRMEQLYNRRYTGNIYPGWSRYIIGGILALYIHDGAGI